MKFMKAIKRLGPGQKLGIKGTDWSWYYKWEYSGYYGGIVLANQDDEPFIITYDSYMSNDWIIKDD